VIFNWVADLQTAEILTLLLLDYQFDAFFSETEHL